LKPLLCQCSQHRFVSLEKILVLCHSPFSQHRFPILQLVSHVSIDLRQSHVVVFWVMRQCSELCSSRFFTFPSYNWTSHRSLLFLLYSFLKVLWMNASLTLCCSLVYSQAEFLPLFRKSLYEHVYLSGGSYPNIVLNCS
jgi:hypothetical protein